MLYPLRFKEALRNYGFGDRWIVEVYEKEGLPEDHRVAETWEICDRPTESSVVINGPLSGQTLHELIDTYGPILLCEGENERTFAFACTYFALERLDLAAPYILDCDGQRFYVLSQIEGRSTVVCGEYREGLRPGNTCLLPASLGPVTLEPFGDCALLKAYVPDLAQDVIAPLRQAGFSNKTIAGLSGHTVLNPLPGLLAR